MVHIIQIRMTKIHINIILLVKIFGLYIKKITKPWMRIKILFDYLLNANLLNNINCQYIPD